MLDFEPDPFMKVVKFVTMSDCIVFIYFYIFYTSTIIIINFINFSLK